MKMMHKDALETFAIFPYVAWGLTIVFAVFVYNITQELQAITADLQAQTAELRHNANIPVNEITDFEPIKKSKTVE
jgi:hypothetical protein